MKTDSRKSSKSENSLSLMALTLFFLLFANGQDTTCETAVQRFPGYQCDPNDRTEGFTQRQFMLYSVTQQSPNGVSEAKTMRVRTALSQQKIQSIKHGFEKLQHFNHPNIMKVYAISTDESSVYDIIQNIRERSFDELFSAFTIKSVSEQKLLLHIKELAQALQEVHNKELLVADLTAASIALSATGTALIGQLDSAVHRGDPLPNSGDFRYWSPTRFSSENNAQIANDIGEDLFAFGVLIYRMFHHGEYPFAGTVKEEVQQSVEKGEYKISATTPIAVAAIISELLRADAIDRLNLNIVNQILSIETEKETRKTLEVERSADIKTGIPMDIIGEVFLEQATKFGTAEDVNRVQKRIGNDSGDFTTIFGFKVRNIVITIAILMLMAGLTHSIYTTVIEINKQTEEEADAKEKELVDAPIGP